MLQKRGRRLGLVVERRTAKESAPVTKAPASAAAEGTRFHERERDAKVRSEKQTSGEKKSGETVTC